MNRPNLHIYRKCSCGETAHDYTGRDTADGRLIFACRNCRAERIPRKRSRKEPSQMKPYLIRFQVGKSPKIHEWTRFAESVESAAQDARKAIAEEYPGKTFRVMSVWDKR